MPSNFLLFYENSIVRSFGTIFVACLVSLSAFHLAAQELPAGRLSPWTTSKIKGSPAPPLPYKTERVFSQVQLDHPTDVVWLPDAQRWIATQLNGKIVAFENDPDAATGRLFLDLSDGLEKPISQALATLFHHDLASQPWLYVTYSHNDGQSRGTRLARFKVIDPNVPTVDPASRVVLASWSDSGHTGGSMQFGPDGMLYVSIGDGQPPYPPDALKTGQDLSDFESSILRIDVDDPTDSQPYRVPADNPFVGLPNVRPEIWAYGFRNPWKIAFDPISGDLLAADVGWEMREMIHRVARGRNHGWSVMEGSQRVKYDETPAIPITPPLFEHTHLDSRSISGGHFWQSDRLPELKGAYLYGDWMTGKVWALKFQGDRVTWQQELVDTPLQIICFMLDPTGEVLIVGYDGTMMRLQTNTPSLQSQTFPQLLSETGLFRDVKSQEPETGVVPYEISAHHWADGTRSQQWIAIPDNEQLTLYDRDDWQTGQLGGRFNFPSDTVVAKTVSYLIDPDDPATERRLETQVLHRLGDEWQAYNYIWNEDQTDAVLQDDVATDIKITIKDKRFTGGQRTQTWRHASRSECLLCHIWAAGTVHGFWPEQLNIGTLQENQLDRLTKLGLFREPVPAKTPIVSPHDTSQPLESRARSYLALNCSTCHRPQGGGTANFNFDLTKSLDENNYIDEVPAQGTFGIPDARVIAAGDPLRSILLYRTLKSGRGHMPQFGSNVIDYQGVRLLRDWILALSDQESSAGDRQHDLSVLKDSVTVDQQIDRFLESPSSALALSLACSDDSIDDDLRHTIVNRAVENEDGLVRDLFEHYLPEDQRVRRLGATIDEAELLAIEGSVERGRQLFEQAKDVNCRLCHQIGSFGKSVGPDLSSIGTQKTAAELLASILRPSEKIDSQYRSRKVLTVDGEVLVGMVTSQTDKQVTLVDVSGKPRILPMDSIEVMELSATSIMPDQLLSGMTPQQAADLLAYLASQRTIGPLQHKQVSIHRATEPIVIDGKCDESQWQAASSVGEFVFTWWNEGDGPQQPTDARLLWDDRYLYVSFQCTDSDIQATRVLRDSDVYRDDCVEVFASPEIRHPENYFNLEMNALGTRLDNYRPQGKVPEAAWDPEGIQVAVVIDGTLNDETDTDRGWTLEAAIPFALFKHVLPSGRPKPGDQWRLNLNRLDGDMTVKSQWSRGDRNRPGFHTPDLFGFATFHD